jgi:aryl-alcohol dehydrogenase-like predicted oxidoreductase
MPSIETEFVNIPRTQLKVSRVALGVAGWSLTDAERESIEHIVNTAVVDPIGPEFMAPPQRP